MDNMSNSNPDDYDEVSSSLESLSASKKSSEGEVTGTLSRPIVFSWHPPSFQEADDVPDSSSLTSLIRETSSKSKLISHEPTLPTETWLLGGPLGCRSASLVFKSSALANCSEISIKEKPAFKLHVTYKVLQAETKLLSKLLECHGVNEVSTNSSDFNLLWTGSHPKPGTLRGLGVHQRVNHFPRSYELTRKDRLYKNIERMQHARGHKHFDFIPQTFVMPSEYAELCTIHHRLKGPWIVKPVASSRGRGIFIVETPNQVPLEEPVVVAKYISKPLLVKGHKCDLRLYVAVSSFDPLLVYIYEEGLVRFATVKYDTSHKQLWNPCMHLCNYSINKYHSDYVKSEDPSAENVGHKWTLSALLRHLKAEGKDTALLMSRIEDLVIKAILSSANSIVSACKMFVPNPNNCFELYGFDILVDSGLKPWLLEINLSPSLGCDSPLDVRLKSAMLADLLTLVGIPAVDPVLRPTTNSSTVTTKASANSKTKLGNCRRVHSADGLSNTLPKKSTSGSFIPSALTLTPEELRIVKVARAQFQRRGGFVRIFPAVDSWAKYSQYLDPATGIPCSNGNSAVSSYNLAASHNFNLLIYTQMFPEVPIHTKVFEKANATKYSSLDRKRDSSISSYSTAQARQNRYERQLSQGHRSALLPKAVLKDNRAQELRKQIMDMLKNGKKLSQCETRKTFSHYLCCVLKRISQEPDQEDHIDIVLKFLQKASNYLRTQYSIQKPNKYLDSKDRAAIVAKQLSDFLHMYNRETELFVDKVEKPSQVPSKLFSEFLECARECDLEEILVHQTTLAVPTHGGKTGFQGILKCIPNAPKNYALKPPFKSLSKAKSLNQPIKSLKVTSLS